MPNYENMELEVLDDEIDFDADDDDGEEPESYALEDDPEFSLGTALGTIATGGLNLAIPAAARALGVGRRPKTARGRGYSSHVRGRRTGRISTPTGTARFRLPTSMVSSRDLHGALAKVGGDVRRNANAIKSTHKKIDAVATTTVQNIKKLESKFDKIQKDKQMQSMLSMFMQPELEKFTLAKDATGDTSAGSEFEISSSSYEDNLLPMMMMFMGDGVSGDDSTQSMMLAMLMMQMNDDDDK